MSESRKFPFHESPEAYAARAAFRKGIPLLLAGVPFSGRRALVNHILSSPHRARATVSAAPSDSGLSLLYRLTERLLLTHDEHLSQNLPRGRSFSYLAAERELSRVFGEDYAATEATVLVVEDLQQGPLLELQELFTLARQLAVSVPSVRMIFVWEGAQIPSPDRVSEFHPEGTQGAARILYYFQDITKVECKPLDRKAILWLASQCGLRWGQPDAEAIEALTGGVGGLVKAAVEEAASRGLSGAEVRQEARERPGPFARITGKLSEELRRRKPRSGSLKEDWEDFKESEALSKTAGPMLEDLGLLRYFAEGRGETRRARVSCELYERWVR